MADITWRPKVGLQRRVTHERDQPPRGRTMHVRAWPFSPGSRGAALIGGALSLVAPPEAWGDTPAADVATDTAGWHDGLFFLRDRQDTFRLYVQGRVHVDEINYFGPGLARLGPDQALKSTFTLRRARLELSGELLQNRFQWALSGEFGPTSVDNVAARNAALDCAVDPISGATSCTTRTSTVEAPAQRPVVTDAFVNYAAAPFLNVQVGQYLIPITLENRVSDNSTPFLERSLPVRTLAAPLQRDIGAMVWGAAPETAWYYALGLFNGDGPNRPNADSRFDVIGRAFTRPLAADHNTFLRDLQVGFSGRYGSRDRTEVGYDMPTLTTQGGYAFWRPTYKDSLGRLTHVLPSSDQAAFAAELFVPLGRFDVTTEVVYVLENTREAIDGYQLSPFAERTGALKGIGYYVQGSAWIMGSRSITSFPSYSAPNRVDLATPSSTPRHGVQVLAKVEQLVLTYQSAERGGVPDRANQDGDVRAIVMTLGATYWATKHLRVSANYGYDFFPSSAPITPSFAGGTAQTRAQRALAPAQNLAPGANDAARDYAHDLHELQFRIGVQF